MSKIISVSDVSKLYKLRQKAKEDNEYFIKSIFRPGRNKIAKEFWALKDINFEVNAGDKLGIIGRNGAGKSTLLKILSRIVAPTTGRIEYEGRIASLLEVGTGFHPELSGRENIFLNGSILGMSKSEIRAKFDEIVSFAEVEQFLDTPVKRYSSGMYVRLAFAVAAHLEPEILIVDEVLAVGDAAFQKKCLGKMKDVSSAGRTILFVSHNMAAVQNLCDHCLYLKNGALIAHGKTEEVMPVYLRASLDSQLVALAQREDRSGNAAIRFLSVSLKDDKGKNIAVANCGDYTVFQLEIEAARDVSNLVISMGIDDSMGQRIAHYSNDVTNQLFPVISRGKHYIEISVPRFPLKSGDYTFTLYSTVNGDIADWIQEAGSFAVEAGDFFRSGKLPPEGQASVFIDHSFSIS